VWPLRGGYCGLLESSITNENVLAGFSPRRTVSPGRSELFSTRLSLTNVPFTEEFSAHTWFSGLMNTRACTREISGSCMAILA